MKYIVVFVLLGLAIVALVPGAEASGYSYVGGYRYSTYALPGYSYYGAGYYGTGYYYPAGYYFTQSYQPQIVLTQYVAQPILVPYATYQPAYPPALQLEPVTQVPLAQPPVNFAPRTYGVPVHDSCDAKLKALADRFEARLKQLENPAPQVLPPQQQQPRQQQMTFLEVNKTRCASCHTEGVARPIDPKTMKPWVTSHDIFDKNGQLIKLTPQKILKSNKYVLNGTCPKDGPLTEEEGRAYMSGLAQQD